MNYGYVLRSQLSSGQCAYFNELYIYTMVTTEKWPVFVLPRIMDTFYGHNWRMYVNVLFDSERSACVLTLTEGMFMFRGPNWQMYVNLLLRV